MEHINNLPNEITLKNEISLVLNDNKPHHGRRNLSDISWYQYNIIIPKGLEIEYDNVCLSSFRITETVRIEASKNIIKNGVSNKDTVRPHIHSVSGNIHPSKEYVAKQKNDKIQQLVLCNGLGPNTPKEQLDTDFYVYNGARVHMACYFPLIDNKLNLQDNWRYKLLEEVWEKINSPMNV